MRVSSRTKLALAAGCAAGLTALGLAAPATAAPQGEIRGAGAEGAIAGSYLVALRDNAPLASAGELAGKHRGQVTRGYDTALRGVAVRMSEADARRLAAEPGVAYVEQDRVVSIAGTQNNPTWGLDRIDQARLPLDAKFTYPDNGGAGITVYVVDTGVRISHREFGGRAANGYDFIDNDAVANDCHGHGTHVAGTVAGTTYGVAKKASVVGVRVLNCQGSGTTSQIVAGLDWVAKNAKKPAVINMSLGGGANSAMDDATRRAIRAGVTTAVASGNSTANACNYSPARVSEAITVNATDRSDNRSSFSNYGTCTDIFAPGTSVTSAWNTSDTATNTISGTSMATPHVAGAAALHLAANSGATPAQVRDALVNNATSDVVRNPGSGSPNKLLNISYLNTGGR
ncbi:S8 family peptidase [Amycolatopsis suaedae]|uniref:S8 family peptidase n=1 Tax=Amycolatopsis suaedae TaxID=2510978 RepID=A0A4Q7JC18_9PSEU|nr:S8 family peptidase [Amycolatopsis suaedae]RZQ64847.1 S8 family peptidase [Amycolatopsis suaedae]